MIAASAGNHALALAYHGKQLGILVTVVMPTLAPIMKVTACRDCGANVILHGDHIGDVIVHYIRIVCLLFSAHMYPYCL